MAELIFSSARLAKCLGLSTRRLAQLADDGVLARTADGFELESSVRRYCEFLRRDEETRKERRALLRAQTDSTRARANRHSGATYSRDDILQRLAEPIAALWDLRAVVTWNRSRLMLDLGELPAIELAHRQQWADLAALIAQARDRLESAFPPVTGDPTGPSDDA